MIATIISLTIPLLLGYLLISIILKDEGDIVEKISLAYPLGAGLITLQLFIAGMIKIPFELPCLLPPLLIEIIVLGIILKKIKVEKAPLSFKPSVLALFILSISLFKIFSIFLETSLRPIYAWDAWANWSAGAKLFYYNKGLMLDRPDEFLGKGYVLRIISYPLHNPLMQTWIALFVGKFDEVLVKFWSPLYLFSMSLILYWHIKKEWNELAGSIVPVIFLSSPLLCYHSIEVYSDLCLGAYIFFSTLSFLYFMKGKKNYLFITALFMAETLFTKDEAIFFAVPLFISLSIYLIKHKNFKGLLVFLIPLIYILPWYLFKFLNSLNIGAESIHFHLVFHPEVIKEIFSLLISLQNFNVIFIAFPLFLLLSGKLEKSFIYLLVPIIFYFTFFVSLYMFTSFYYEQFMVGTVFFRNMLTLYPSLTLLCYILAKNYLSSN